MFVIELQKLFSKRLLQIFIVIILLGNGILGYVNETIHVSVVDVNANAYIALQEDLQKLDEEEKVSYILEGLEYVDAMRSVQRYAMFGYNEEDEKYFQEQYPTYSLEECMKEYESDTYLQYTTNLVAERQLYKEVQDEMNLCNTYTEYVNNILERTLGMLKKVENQNSYTFRNMAETYFAFEEVKDVQTSYGPSRGVAFVCNCITTDLWALLFVFIVSVLLVTVERENNLLILLKTTKRGRETLGLRKLFVLYSACLVVMLLHIENFFIANTLYGMGDFSRSIQSVAGYQGCTLSVSVGEFLVLCFGMKLLIYLMCASLIFTICTLFMKSLWVYLTVMGSCIGCGLLYYAIDNHSSIVWLRELSPVALLQVNTILGTYKNLQFGEFAVNRFLISIVVALVICLAASIISVLLFARKKEKQTKSHTIEIPIFQKVAVAMEKHTYAFAHELYRIFVKQHVFIILILVGLFLYKTFQPVMPVVWNEDELYYKSMITKVIGPEENVSEDYWNEVEAEYLKVYEEANLEQNVSIMQNMQNAFRAITRLKQHDQYLETKPGSWYVYDVGYGILTDSERDYENAEYYNVMYSIVIGVFCFVGMYAMDYQKDGIRLLRTTKYGRKRFIMHKFLIGIVISSIIFCMVWLPQLVYTLKKYGTMGIEAPVYSMEHLSWLPQWISIKGYLVLLYSARFIGIVTLMLLAFAIAMKCRSFIVSTCVTLGITILPIGLCILNVNFMKYVFLTPMLMGNPLFTSGKMGLLLFCLLQEVLIAGISMKMIQSKE